MELINDSTRKFNDITSEEFRTYEFPEGPCIRIDNPIAIYVSENGHRVLDQAGISHYIPKSWIHLTWKAKEGQPHFMF